MNHTRFPKEDHQPDSARRENQVKMGYRVERLSFSHPGKFRRGVT